MRCKFTFAFAVVLTLDVTYHLGLIFLFSVKKGLSEICFRREYLHASFLSSSHVL